VAPPARLGFASLGTARLAFGNTTQGRSHIEVEANVEMGIHVHVTFTKCLHSRTVQLATPDK
jgi:hypothetical protein